MNLNREMLKSLITEAISELSEEQPAAAAKPEAPTKDDKGDGLKNLEVVEARIKEELEKYLAGAGTALKKLVETNTAGKSSKIKARVLTVIAESFGISADETRQDLASAGDQMRGK